MYQLEPMRFYAVYELRELNEGRRTAPEKDDDYYKRFLLRYDVTIGDRRKHLSTKAHQKNGVAPIICARKLTVELNILLASYNRPQLLSSGRNSGAPHPLLWLLYVATKIDPTNLLRAFNYPDSNSTSLDSYPAKLDYITYRTKSTLKDFYAIDMASAKIVKLMSRLVYHGKFYHKVQYQRMRPLYTKEYYDKKANRSIKQYMGAMTRLLVSILKGQRPANSAISPGSKKIRADISLIERMLLFLTTTTPCTMPSNPKHRDLVLDMADYHGVSILHDYNQLGAMLARRNIYTPRDTVPAYFATCTERAITLAIKHLEIDFTGPNNVFPAQVIQSTLVTPQDREGFEADMEFEPFEEMEGLPWPTTTAPHANDLTHQTTLGLDISDLFAASPLLSCASYEAI